MTAFKNVYFATIESFLQTDWITILNVEEQFYVSEENFQQLRKKKHSAERA